MSEKELLIMMATKCADLESQLAEARELAKDCLDAIYVESDYYIGNYKTLESRYNKLKGEG